MKGSLILVSAICGLASVSLNSKAAVFFTDTFSYGDGSLTAVSGGNWTAHSGAGAKPIQVGSGAITLQQNAGSGEDLNRNTGGVMGAGDTWYAGFDVTVTGGNTDVYFASFLKGGTTGIFQDRTFVTAGTAGDFTFGLGTGATATAKWGTDLSFGTTYRVVLAYNYDTMQNTLWVNPLLQTDPSISVSSTSQDTIASFAVRQSTGNSFQVMDNLVVATTFTEAMVVPEPSSMALGLLGAAGLALARRRKA